MLFEIIKPITATLRIECNSKEEAMIWANRIVATIEDENRRPFLPNRLDYFEAETVSSEIKINALK